MSTAVNAAASPSQQGGFRRFWRAIKQLFHEVIAGIFLVLALGWFNIAFRAWSRDAAFWLVSVSVAVAVLFVFFAITSFRKARKL